MTKISDIYEETADVIEKYGHHRGDLGTPGKGFCVIGAMAFVGRNYDQGMNKPRSEAYYDACRRLADMADSLHPSGGVADWSDDAPTQEVVDTLRKLGKEARLEEEGIR